MQVFIKYRNYKKIHPIYQSLLSNPPEGIKYTIPGIKTNLGKAYKIYNKFRQYKLVSYFGKRAQDYLFRPSESKYLDYDVVHLVDQLPSNYEKASYILDIGAINSLVGFTKIEKMDAEKIKQFFLHATCKAILVRSIATEKMIAEFCKAYLSSPETRVVLRKINLVYPAAPIIDIASKEKPTNIIRVLFIGNGIYKKGLHETIAAYRKLKKSGYSVSLTVVANDFDQLSVKYLSKDINFHKAVYSKQEIVEKFFSTHDVFVMPSHYEIFGMVYLDAYSAGMPCIGINQYSTPEIIIDGQTGYIIESRRRPLDESWNFDSFDDRKLKTPEKCVVDELYKKLKSYCENRSLMLAHGKAGRALVKSGKFSVKTRNAKLKSIYEKAIS